MIGNSWLDVRSGILGNIGVVRVWRFAVFPKDIVVIHTRLVVLEVHMPMKDNAGSLTLRVQA